MTPIVHRVLATLIALHVLAAAGTAAQSAPGGAPAAAPRPGTKDGPIVVRVLSAGECVNTPPTIELVKATAAELGLAVDVTRVIIATPGEARQHRFFGSPTVQVDGLDIEPKLRGSTNYTLS